MLLLWFIDVNIRLIVEFKKKIICVIIGFEYNRLGKINVNWKYLFIENIMLV